MTITTPIRRRPAGTAMRFTPIEHLKREGNKLLYQITIDDPKIFTRPFSQDFELTLRPDWDQLGPSGICLRGKQSMCGR